MKRIFLLLMVVLFAVDQLYAEKAGQVSIRFGRQNSGLRIVLDSDDKLIKNSNIASSLTVIKIEFPAEFEFKKQKDFPFETTKQDHSLIILLKDVEDVKISRLYGPARIVIDLKTEQKKQQETAQKPEQKAQPEPANPPVQKMQKEQAQQTAPKNPPPPPQTAQKNPQGAPPSEKRKPRSLVIDPGHGGYDYGIFSHDAKEKDVSLNIAKDLSSSLSKKGFVVFLTRRADQSASILERVNYSNGKNPDIFMSLHASLSPVFVINISTAEETNIDAEIRPFSLSSKQTRHIDRSRALARALAQVLKNEFDIDALIRELPLPLLNSMNAPAVLMELPLLGSFASDQKMRVKFVNSVLKGISSYEQ